VTLGEYVEKSTGSSKLKGYQTEPAAIMEPGEPQMIAIFYLCNDILKAVTKKRYFYELKAHGMVIEQSQPIKFFLTLARKVMLMPIDYQSTAKP
jgi:hypothetical protein